MRNEDGSILLEALIAFAIAILALTTLMDGALSGLRATRVAGGYEEAVARARSHLAALDGRVRVLRPGQEEGDDGHGFHWLTRVTPVASTVVSSNGPTLAGGTTAMTEVLYGVSATISWTEDGKERRVSLSSSRIAAESSR